MGFYKELNKEKSYHRAIFLFATAALAGICSIYPMACFKKFSGREKAKVDQELANLERQQRQDNEWERTLTKIVASRRAAAIPRTTARRKRITRLGTHGSLAGRTRPTE
jgi:hypothetical protein